MEMSARDFPERLFMVGVGYRSSRGVDRGSIKEVNFPGVLLCNEGIYGRRNLSQESLRVRLKMTTEI